MLANSEDEGLKIAIYFCAALQLSLGVSENKQAKPSMKKSYEIFQKFALCKRFMIKHEQKWMKKIVMEKSFQFDQIFCLFQFTQI